MDIIIVCCFTFPLNIQMKTTAVLTALLVTGAAAEYRNELDFSFPSGPEVRKTAEPHTYMKGDDIPDSVDYRSQGLLTADLNQHIPVYCGSCWAHSAMSSLGDRLKIQNKGKGRDIIPSVQALINCGHAGSCNGGNPGAANREVHRMGVPDMTCQAYQAKNMDCTAMNTCQNCDHDPDIGCSAVKEVRHTTPHHTRTTGSSSNPLTHPLPMML